MSTKGTVGSQVVMTFAGLTARVVDHKPPSAEVTAVDDTALTDTTETAISGGITKYGDAEVTIKDQTGTVPVLETAGTLTFTTAAGSGSDVKSYTAFLKKNDISKVEKNKIVERVLTFHINGLAGS